MTRRSFAALWLAKPTLEIEQITHGPNHHFFGYIGHVRNIPWNAGDRYLVALRTTFQDRMPRSSDAADVVLIDTRRNHEVRAIDRSRGWNFQQGTMFYWNPRSAESQLFFNDRDPKTGHVFTVLADAASGKRLREYRYADTPFGNSGVAQLGGFFLGLNYGRLARLRPVTGYPESYDWNPSTPAPDNDGIFRVEIDSGAKRLLVSYRQLRDLVKSKHTAAADRQLFINHTLSNRDSTRVYFFLRGHFAEPRDRRTDLPCTMRTDGSRLTMQETHIGGHPEWENGARIIGSHGGRQVIFDTDAQRVAETIASPEILPDPGADVALSPDGKWFANGYRKGHENFYVLYNRVTGEWTRSRGFPHPGMTSGDLRVDGSPCWNRASSRILFPAIAADGTRQLFVAQMG